MKVTGTSECWKPVCCAVHLLNPSGGFYSK